MCTLCDLAQAVFDIEKRHLDGVIIETGVGSGGSAIVLGATKTRDRRLFLYDVFGLHPPPSDNDGLDARQRYNLIATGKSPGIGGDLYYGYEKDLYNKVLRSLAHFGLEATTNNFCLEKGLYEDTLQIKSPVSLAHIDCDWYDSVLTCLNRIEPHLVRGGTIVVNNYWPGVQKAVDKYFENRDKNNYSFIQKSALYIVRN